MTAQHPILGGAAASIDTDEWWDGHVTRPLAAHIARWLKHTRVTPNQITSIACAFGVACAFLVGTGRLSVLIWAGIFLFANTVLDCADGQLARLRGGGSFMGRMWDGFSDWIVCLAIHIGLMGFMATHSVALFGRQLSGVTFFLIGLAAIMSMCLHCMYYDLKKNNLKGLAGYSNETDTPESVTARIDAADNRGTRFFLQLYRAYCRLQGSSPAKSAPRTAVSMEQLQGAQHRFKRWQPIGPGMHLVAFTVAILLASVAPWAVLLYLGYNIVFGNLMMVWLLRNDRLAEA